MTVSNLNTRSSRHTHLPHTNSPCPPPRGTDCPSMWVNTVSRSTLLEGELTDIRDLERETEEPRDNVLPVKRNKMFTFTLLQYVKHLLSSILTPGAALWWLGPAPSSQRPCWGPRLTSFLILAPKQPPPLVSLESSATYLALVLFTSGGHLGQMDFFPLLSNRWGNCKLKQNLAQMFHTDTDGNSHHLLLTAWCCEHCMINIRQNKVCFWTTHISWIHFLFGLEGKNSKIFKHNFGFWLIRPQEAFTSTHSITNEAQRGLLGFWPLFVFFCFAWWSSNFHLWFQHWSVVSPQSDFHYRTMCVLM